MPFDSVPPCFKVPNCSKCNYGSKMLRSQVPGYYHRLTKEENFLDIFETKKNVRPWDCWEWRNRLGDLSHALVDFGAFVADNLLLATLESARDWSSYPLRNAQLPCLYITLHLGGRRCTRLQFPQCSNRLRCQIRFSAVLRHHLCCARLLFLK